MSWFSRIKNSIRSKQMDQELAEEIADHLARRAADLVSQGTDPAAAQYDARRRFGNATRIQQQSRDLRILTSLDNFLQDLCYAWRTISKSRAFAITAVLSLTLAIGANTAIYSILDASILRSLPVPHASQLIAVSYPDTGDTGGSGGDVNNWSYPEYLRLSAGNRFIELSVFSSLSRIEVHALHLEAPLEKVSRAFVSANAFEMLGVSPATGRLFAPAEDQQNGQAVVLSYEYWQRRFLGNRDVVGRLIFIDNKPVEIRGVAMKGFFGIEPGKFVDIWSSVATHDQRTLNEIGWHWLSLLGRVAPGYSLERAEAALQIPYHLSRVELTQRFQTMPRAIKQQLLDSKIRLSRAPNGTSDFREMFAKPLWIVFGIAQCMFLVACANVAGLLLARSVSRKSEIATRFALGADRWRIVQQMLTEGLLLSVVAGTGGWFVAKALTAALVRILSTSENPLQLFLGIDTRALLFCAVIATLSTLLFALIPAWQSSDVQSDASLRASTRTTRHSTATRFFIGAQITGSFCLVILGCAFFFSLGRILRVNPGFDAHNVMVFEIVTNDLKNDGSNAWDQRSSGMKTTQNHMAELEERVSRQAGVQFAATAFWPIFSDEGWSGHITLPGQRTSGGEEAFYRVSGQYFSTLRTPITLGRTFVASDSYRKDSTPVIVNEAFAQKYFRKRDVLGQQFQSTAVSTPLVVVGVSMNSHYNSLRQPAAPLVYVPLTGSYTYSLYVRSPLPASQTTRIVERQAAEMGGLHLRTATSLETLVGETLRREQLLATVASTLGLLGGLLAGIGVFGFLTLFVTQRKREIGIRVALGAQPRQIVGFALVEVAWIFGAGLAIGLLVALCVLSMLKNLLFELQPWEPSVTVVAALIFLLIGLVALGLPAIRASGIDPAEALREQ